MEIYHDLETMKLLAMDQAKKHKCNYNVIISNPDENGEYNKDKGSTYEMVADSYFEKDRPNAKLICKTDDLLKTPSSLHSGFNSQNSSNKSDYGRN